MVLREDRVQDPGKMIKAPRAQDKDTSVSGEVGNDPT